MNLSLMQQVYSDETLPHARVFEWHKDGRQRKMMRNPPVHPPHTLPKTLSEFEIFCNTIVLRRRIILGFVPNFWKLQPRTIHFAVHHCCR
jgi:hypothetical protein